MPETKRLDGDVDELIFSARQDDHRARNVSVKGCFSLCFGMIGDSKGVLNREMANIGVFVSLIAPTDLMRTEVA